MTLDASEFRTIASAVSDLAGAIGGDGEQVARAIDANFTSPNVRDSNLEPANVVDVLDSMAGGLYAITRAPARIATVMESTDKEDDA
jgi:hypothetical protein